MSARDRVLRGRNTGPGKEMSVTKRLQSELMALIAGKHEGISAFPDGDRFLTWTATIQGPPDSVYEGLQFRLSMDFPSDYPFRAPTVRFLTDCYHPNVDHNGNICLDILNSKWSAVYNVSTVLLSIQNLLGDPNVESPLNGDAAKLWSNPQEYANELRKKYAEGKK